MMKILRLLLTIIVSLITVCITLSCNQNDVTNTDKSNMGSARASWATGYPTLEAMVTDTQIIVTGAVEKMLETTQKSEYIWETLFAFRVENVLKGQVDKQIVIIQTGTYGRPETIFADNPLFLAGERYLLFLNNNEEGTYSHFGPLGRYKIDHDRVYSMNYVLSDEIYNPEDPFDFDGVELSAITETVQNILDTDRFYCSSRGHKLLSGETARSDIVFATGKGTEGELSYDIEAIDPGTGSRISLPVGMSVAVEPAEFQVSPRTDYRSVFMVQTYESIITPGDYQFVIYSRLNGEVRGSQVISIEIDSLKMSDIETEMSQIRNGE